MPEDDPDVGTPKAFNAALQTLLQQAHAEGVEVDGAWECLNAAAHPDWDVVITEMERPND